MSPAPTVSSFSAMQALAPALEYMTRLDHTIVDRERDIENLSASLAHVMQSDQRQRRMRQSLAWRLLGPLRLLKRRWQDAGGAIAADLLPWRGLKAEGAEWIATDERRQLVACPVEVAGAQGGVDGERSVGQEPAGDRDVRRDRRRRHDDARACTDRSSEGGVAHARPPIVVPPSLLDGRHRRPEHRDRVRLKLALRGKRLGFSLNEIRELFELYDLAHDERRQLEEFLAKLEKRRAMLEQQREDIEVMLNEVSFFAGQCRRLLAGNGATNEQAA